MPDEPPVEERAPKVTVALPVFNGENFIDQALQAIRAQTFEDFEVVISDNASDDGTPDICMGHAVEDPRIRYFRYDDKVGAGHNFNRAFELARGEYFRWASHDDSTHPKFLEKCVEVLDHDPGVVLAHTKVEVIDALGNHVDYDDYGPQTGSESLRKRFFDLLFVHNKCFEVFGLIRTDQLRETGLMGAFPVGDRVLLCELAFRGRFHEVEDHLFLSRDHGNRSVRRLVTQAERAAWFNSRYEGKIPFPEWRTFVEYLKAIRRAPLGLLDRTWAYLYMVKWVRHYRKRMRRDVVVGTKTWLVRSMTRWRHRFSVAAEWARRTVRENRVKLAQRSSPRPEAISSSDEDELRLWER